MRPPSIDEFIEKNAPDQSKLIKAGIQAFIDWVEYWQYGTCAVCDKELSDHEKMTIGYSDYNRTCMLHRNYGLDLSVTNVRKKMGFPARPDYWIE